MTQNYAETSGACAQNRDLERFVSSEMNDEMD